METKNIINRPKKSIKTIKTTKLTKNTPNEIQTAKNTKQKKPKKNKEMKNTILIIIEEKIKNLPKPGVRCLLTMMNPRLMQFDAGLNSCY